jgi:hypothetical protein
MLASTAPKALLKSSCPATPATSAAEAALSLLRLRLGLKLSPFKTLYDREIERFNELPDYLSALGWSK